MIRRAGSYGALSEFSGNEAVTPGGTKRARQTQKSWLDKQLAAIDLLEAEGTNADQTGAQSPPAKLKRQRSERLNLTCRIMRSSNSATQPAPVMLSPMTRQLRSWKKPSIFEARALRTARIGRRSSAASCASDQAATPAQQLRDVLGVWVVGAEHSASVIISEVEPGSCAARAGLRAGDILLKINGVMVMRKVEAKALISRTWGAMSAGEGGHIELEVSRSRSGRLPEGWRQRVREDGGVIEYYKVERAADGSVKRYLRSSREGRDHPAIFDV